ncbi:MAG: triacylglycerol lipase [Pseudomonadales bacterium]|nr:triacylglycerol lipase [Pseudomonadales bacterium]
MLLRNFLCSIAIILATSACMPEIPGLEVDLDIGTTMEIYTANPDITYTQTQHPIVLVHGLNGFDHMLGVNYFYNVTEALEHGGATVMVPSMSALHTNEVRGEQLLKQIKEFLAISGATKVNLFGHSHGAPTARYVAAVAPELVASISTMGGVNALGSEKAAMINDAFNDPVKGLAVEVALISLGLLFDILSNEGDRHAHPQTVRSTFYSVGYEGTEEFNQRYPAAIPVGDPCNEGEPEVDGVKYYSWGGIGVKTNKMDPLDKILEVTIPYFEGIENDGTISRCASHLGRVIRDDYNLNHTDLTNQAFGLRHARSVNPLNLYRAHANRLKQAGL